MPYNAPMLRPDAPALIPAPMEGVTDTPMRAALGEGSAFTYAVAEFLRVAHTVPGRAVVRRLVPELMTGGRTPSGFPVLRRLVGWVGRFPGGSAEGTVRRLKQWLALAERHGGFAGFESLKRAGTVDELLAGVRAACRLDPEGDGPVSNGAATARPACGWVCGSDHRVPGDLPGVVG